MDLNATSCSSYEHVQDVSKPPSVLKKTHTSYNNNPFQGAVIPFLLKRIATTNKGPQELTFALDYYIDEKSAPPIQACFQGCTNLRDVDERLVVLLRNMKRIVCVWFMSCVFQETELSLGDKDEDKAKSFLPYITKAAEDQALFLHLFSLKQVFKRFSKEEKKQVFHALRPYMHHLKKNMQEWVILGALHFKKNL